MYEPRVKMLFLLQVLVQTEDIQSRLTSPVHMIVSMIAIIILCIVPAQGVTLIQGSSSPPVLLLERSEVYLTSNSWILTLSVDVQKHGVAIEVLRNHTETFSLQAAELFSQMDRLMSSRKWFAKRYHIKHIWLLHKELQFALAEVQELQSNYKDVAELYLNLNNAFDIRSATTVDYAQGPRRTKRFLPLLLSLVGGAMSVASLVEVHGLRGQIRSLSVRQNALLKSHKEMVLILNQTMLAVDKNARDIELMSEHFNQAIEQIQYHHNQLAGTFTTEATIEAISALISTSLSFIHMATRRAQIDLLTLSQNLQSAMNGQLPPSMLPKKDLTTLLTSIENDLPAEMKMGTLDSNAYLTPVLLFATNQEVFISIAFPLASTPRDVFTLYDIVHHPTMGDDSSITQLNIPPNIALAVSKDAQNYRLLTKDQMTMCMGGGHHAMCPIADPTYDIFTSSECIIAWYRRDKELIMNNCKKSRIIQEKVPGIRVTELAFNEYLIFSVGSLHFLVSCDTDITEQYPSFTIPPATNTRINIPPGCRAVNEQITLFSKRRRHTSAQAKTFLDVQLMELEGLHLNNLSNIPWTVDELAISNFNLTKAGIPQWVHDSINKMKQDLDNMDPLVMGGFSITKLIIYLSIGVLLLLIVGLVIYIKCPDIGASIKLKRTDIIPPTYDKAQGLVEAVLPVVQQINKQAHEAIPSAPGVQEAGKTPSIYPQWVQNKVIS